MGTAAEWPCQTVVNDVFCTVAIGGSVLELGARRARQNLPGPEQSSRMQSEQVEARSSCTGLCPTGP
jgi:hypothetical protein